MLPLLFLMLAARGEHHIHAVVLDSADHQPVVGVVVRVLHSNQGAVTDHHGTFHLNMHTKELSDSVCVALTRVGYQTDTVCLSTDSRIQVVWLTPRTSQFSDVVVVGKRSESLLPTGQETLLDDTDVDEHRGQTIADVLEQIPAVTVLRTGSSVAKPMIRGVTGQRVVISNHGTVMEGQQWGEDHGPEVDPFTPMRLTVVQGPASVRYGPGAMGGVIHISPPPVSFAHTHGELSMNMFTNNVQGAVGGWLNLAQPLNTPAALRLFGGARKAGDMQASRYRLDNTAFEQFTGGMYLQVGEHVSKPQVRVYGSVFNATLGVFSASHLGNPGDLARAVASDTPLVAAGDRYNILSPHQEVQHITLMTELRMPIRELGLASVRYGWQNNYRNEFDRHNSRIVGRGADSAARAQDSISRLQKSLETPALSLMLTTYSLDASLDHHPIGQILGNVGISAIRQVNSRGGTVSLIPDYVLLGVGGYIHEMLALDSILFSAALRYDVRWLDAWPGSVRATDSERFSAVYSSLSGGLGMRTSIGGIATVTANLGVAWRPPHVNELFANGVHHGAARYEVGNSSLTPERNYGADVAITIVTSAFELTTSAYAALYSGFIQALPDPSHPTVTIRGTFPTFRFSQTDALIAGANLQATVPVTNELSVVTRASVVYGQDQRLEQPLFMMPANRFRAGLHLHDHDVLGFDDVFADVGLQGVATQHRFVQGQDITPPPPGYMVIDAMVGGNITLFATTCKWSVAATNLFNTAYRDYLSRYRYFSDDAGRDILFRFTIPFGGTE